MTCNSSGGVDRYRFCDETNDVKIICKKLLKNDDEELTSTANIGLMSICDVTAFIWFDEKMFMVGTSDGLLFTRKSSFLPTNTAAHFGPVKSLERSPYSSHLYLTTGCDCSVKIWVGDIFVEPAIILKAGQQIQKAAWSRTNPTVIVSVVGTVFVCHSFGLKNCGQLQSDEYHFRFKNSLVPARWSSRAFAVRETE